MIENQRQSDDDNRVTAVTHPTKINLVINGQQFPAELNDTTTSKAILDKLPMTVTVSQGMHDYCGTTDHFPFDQSDVQSGWFNGDLAFDISGDWFVIFLRGANNDPQYREVKIGQLETTDEIKQIAALPGTIEVQIERVKEG